MSDNPCSKTIVAVHGVGNQTKFETVKKVLTQFALYHEKKEALVPLGKFNNKNETVTCDFAYTDRGGQRVVTNFNFAEAYWANIPRKLIDEGFQIEEAKSWGQSVAGRAAADGKTREKLVEVLGEGLQTLDVLERLFLLAGKLWNFKFDLKRVIEDSLDDVQVVGDFEDKREEIVNAFERQVANAYAQDPEAEIYIVAHSEGTVVSLLAMLRAACESAEVIPDITLNGQPVKRRDWLNRVHGYMTIGSPIDTHIALWDHIFKNYGLPKEDKPKPQIKWYNYYDFGDPIGFKLEDARERMEHPQWNWENVFEFRDADDYGFTRSPWPGAAHNAYWTDEHVFGHFIENVIYAKDAPENTKYVQDPPTKPLAWVSSYLLPYVFDFALLICAVWVLYKALKGYLPEVEAKSLHIRNGVIGNACLLAGLTFIARITRLTKPGFWWAFGGLFFVVMSGLYCWLNDSEFWDWGHFPSRGGHSITAYVGIVISYVVLLCYGITR